MAGVMDLLREGHAKLRAGHAAAAAERLRQARAADPGNVDAMVLLGMALRKLGKLEEAASLHRQAAGARRDDVGVLGELGLTLLTARQMEEAAGVFRRIVALRPDLASAHYFLGRALAESSDLDAALASMTEAVRLEPGNADYKLGLAGVELSRGRPRTAIKLYREVMPARPEMPEIHLRLGNAYSQLGVMEEAEACFRRVLALRANDPYAIAGLAQCAETQGDFERAAEIIERAVGGGVPQPGLAVALARVRRRQKRAGEAIPYARRALEQAMPKYLRAAVLHALAQLHEDLGEYDEAYARYAATNEAERTAFDPGAYEARVSAIIAAFGGARMKALARSTVRSGLFVYIVGMPRSGTTLAEQIIDAHPRAFGAGELGHIRAVTETLASLTGRAEGYPEGVAALTPAVLDRVSGEHVERMRRQAGEGVERVTDKMPSNYMDLGLVELLYPDCRVVHCTRDAMDTCWSLFATRMSVWHQYSFTQEGIALAYAQYRRVMRHWREVLTVPMLELGYEDMVREQRARSEELVAFCGLEWDEACLRFHETKRVVTTASVDQVNKPMYSSSVGRWRRFEKHLGPMRAALERELRRAGEPGLEGA